MSVLPFMFLPGTAMVIEAQEDGGFTVAYHEGFVSSHFSFVCFDQLVDFLLLMQNAQDTEDQECAVFN